MKDFAEIAAPFTSAFGRTTGLFLLLASLSLPAFAAGAPGVAAAEWKPVDQPGLAAQFAQAQPLKLDDVAEGPDENIVGPRYWVPHADGKSGDLLLLYDRAYMGPHELFIFDFATGKLKRQEFYEAGGSRHMFHLTPAWLIKGKLVIQALPGGGDGPDYWTYDPAEKELKFGGWIGGGKLAARGGWTVADDGTIYGIAQVRGTQQFACYKLDVATGQSEVLTPPVGRKDYRATEGIYATFAMEGDWVYGAIGNTPWRLYAFNVKERAGKVIAESPLIVGDYRTMHLSPSEYAAVKLTTDKGLEGIGGAGTYWLKDGQVLKGEGDAPPAGIGKRAAAKKDYVYTGHENERPLPADIELLRTPVGADGTVRVWYRLKGAALAAAQAWYPAAVGPSSAEATPGEWAKFDFKVTYYPNKAARILPLADGRIFALPEGYGRAVMIDPQKKTREVLGKMTMSPYAMTAYNGKIYIVGYPSCRFWEYDPAKPWNVAQALLQDQPPADKTALEGNVGATAPDSNPKLLAMLEDSGLHNPIVLVGPAADGRFYMGGYRIRVANGGGLAWWDLKAGKGGGLIDPFSAYRIYWMCLAGDGRYVVLSTKPTADDKNPAFTPERGRLFVYDTKTGALNATEDKALATPGYVTEALPGLVLGYTSAGDDRAGAGLLYGFDPAAGKVLWTKPVPARPVTAMSAMRRSEYFFDKGPDGMIWATMGDVLARINPRNAEVAVVGKLGNAALAFSGGDVYVAGGTSLRRIAGLKVEPAGK